MSWLQTGYDALKRQFMPAGTSGLRSRAAYDAAGGGRRLRSWNPTPAGPNADLMEADQLRARSHDLVRNNAWVKRGTNAKRANEIGTGITPRSQSLNDAFRKQVAPLWDKWVKVADANQVVNFYGLQALATQARQIGGEQFIRRRMRPLGNGLPVPMQIELLSAEYCPVNYNQDLPGGRHIRAGIEFDGIAKRRAYWMYKSHPSDPFSLSHINDLVAVPADSVIHHYQPLMGGQIRGLPDTIQAMIQSRTFREYEDAELVRKRDKSTITGVITKPPYEDADAWLFDPVSGEPITKDASGVPNIALEPGTFAALNAGESITQFEGDNTGQGFKDFARQQLLGIAAGMDMPYEILSGDFAGVNDRILRFIVNEWRRRLEQDQWLCDIPQICERVWQWFIEAAVMSGALDAPGYLDNPDDYLACEWRPDGWPYIHPEQDVNAKIKSIRAGLTSQSQVAAEQGESAIEIDEQNAADKQRHEKLGLNYDIEVEDSAAADDPAEDPAEDGNDDDDEQQRQYNRLKEFKKVNARHYEI